MASQGGPQQMSDFLKLLNSLVTDPSTGWIDRVLKDNEAMKACVEDQQKDYNGVVRAMGKLSNDLQIEAGKAERAAAQSDEAKARAGELATEVDDARKNIAEKDQQLQQDAQVIIDLQTKLEARDKEVEARDELLKKHEEQRTKSVAAFKEYKQELVKTKDELATKSVQLKEIEQLSYEMVTASKDYILGELHKVYTAAKMLATSYFGEDLPDKILAGPLFDAARNDFSRINIPLPASNSIAAKKARIAAFLATLGSKLTARIFVPFYLLPHESQERPPDDIDDIATMLWSLSRQDQKKEVHLRSVLLAISPSIQKEVAHERGLDIAEEVYEELGILLSSDQQSNFEHDIKQFCDMAVESWERLRPLKDKIEPFDEETSEHTELFWLPAEFDFSKPHANGKPKDTGDNSNGLVSKPSLHSMNASKTGVCVWPGFYLGGQVLKRGFMLLDSQVKSAADEDAPPSRRSVRAKRRASGGVQVSRRFTRKSKGP
ncbi:hypothetical protein HD806DRAFT_311311 [Xylariaceae sp. AK1471]|nr:hypothetical protein HD806DRAFT_311311 [Xylariaceae sp. AK1471]